MVVDLENLPNSYLNFLFKLQSEKSIYSQVKFHGIPENFEELAFTETTFLEFLFSFLFLLKSDFHDFETQSLKLSVFCETDSRLSRKVGGTPKLRKMAENTNFRNSVDFAQKFQKMACEFRNEFF